MRTIGLIGGTGWASSMEYYRYVNEFTNRRLGGHQFSKCVLYSLNFHDVVKLKQQGKSVFPLLLDAAEKLAAAGADCLLICANTMHQYADELQKKLSLPILHIAEETAKVIFEQQLSRVGLIGSQPTMEMDFFISKLHAHHIACVVPGASDRIALNAIVMDELARGVFTEASRKKTMNIVNKMNQQSIQGLILGCTEFPLLLRKAPFSYPIFNTTEIHAMAAVDFALSSTDF
ncbi:amino acid racemase [bacterium]|nr:amino acid racemase [bacterium]